MTVVIVVFVVFVLVVVAVASLSAIGSRADRQWFELHGQQVQGEIVGLRVRRQTSMTPTGDGVMMTNTTRWCVPTVRFTTADGKVIETETRTSSRRPGNEGDFVNVSYDPADPSRARIVNTPQDRASVL